MYFFQKLFLKNIDVNVNVKKNKNFEKHKKYMIN